MKEITIQYENGLHMRPVTQVVKIATEFPGDVTISKD